MNWVDCENTVFVVPPRGARGWRRSPAQEYSSIVAAGNATGWKEVSVSQAMNAAPGDIQTMLNTGCTRILNFVEVVSNSMEITDRPVSRYRESSCRLTNCLSARVRDKRSRVQGQPCSESRADNRP